MKGNVRMLLVLAYVFAGFGALEAAQLTGHIYVMGGASWGHIAIDAFMTGAVLTAAAYESVRRE